jgi:ABC-type glycerol-3-phosphate transport system substrate-binding protein
VISPAQLPHWAAAGKLQEIPSRLTAAESGYDWDSLLPLYRHKLLAWDQKTYALPLLGDAFLCFYRADLLQNAQHRESFRKMFGHELPDPKLREIRWEQFRDMAAYFHNRPRAGTDHPCPSLAPLPIADEELDREFYSVAVSFARRGAREDEPKRSGAELLSFHYDLETGQARIQTPGFVHALELLRSLQAFRPAQPAAQPPASFAKGEAVLCLASPAWIGRFQKSPQVRGKFGFCRLPGSSCFFDYRTGAKVSAAGGNYVPYLGANGWVMVVPQSSSQAEAAFALAASLSGPKTSRDIVIEPDWGGGIFRRAHLENFGWQAFGLEERTELLLDDLRETVAPARVLNPVVRLRIPDEREHQQALVAEVRAAVTGRKDPSQALKDAAQRWQEIDARKDAKRRLADYRLSLSLSATE